MPTQARLAPLKEEIEVSNNRYRDVELSPIEVAAVQNEIDRLNNGIWDSEVSMKSALRSPGYSVQGPLGEAFRAAWDNKGSRTIAAGYNIGGKNRVIDRNGNARKATARFDAEGNIVAQEVPWHQNNTSVAAPAPTSEDEDGPSKPVVERLPGGTLRAKVNSSHLPLIKQSVETVEKNRNEVAKRQAEAKAQASGLPLIVVPPPVKKKE
jgi:hypothetical protein